MGDDAMMHPLSLSLTLFCSLSTKYRFTSLIADDTPRYIHGLSHQPLSLANLSLGLLPEKVNSAVTVTLRARGTKEEGKKMETRLAHLNYGFDACAWVGMV